MNLPFVLKPIKEGAEIPKWDGKGFRIDQEFTQVLQYSNNDLGWNDELTDFHEETAGDNHFIDCASRDHAISQLKQRVYSKNSTILEVGCSSGYMLHRMQKTFPEAIIIGSDVVNEPLLKLANNLPDIPLFRFDMQHCPLPDNSMDAVVMLNVLEHIENDTAVLQQTYRILKPGGMLVVEVPSGPHLYDIYDKVLKHYRRYDATLLAQLIAKQGFVIQKKSHLGFFLYPAFSWVKKRNKRLLMETENLQRKHVKKAITNTGSNHLLHLLMRIELQLGKLLSFPVGIRCLITCIKAN